RGWLAAALCFAAGFPAAAQEGARYLGVASCAGSTCHGRAEGNGAVVRQDEIASWQESSSATGAHSRALAVLDTLRARRSRPRSASATPARRRRASVATPRSCPEASADRASSPPT